MQKREAKETDYERSYSATPAYALTTDLYGDSDFLRAIKEKDPRDAGEIMDDLMDTLHTVNPRVYDGVMRKIRSL